MYILHDLGTAGGFVVVDIWNFDEFNNQFQHKIHCKLPVKTNHKIISANHKIIIKTFRMVTIRMF